MPKVKPVSKEAKEKAEKWLEEIKLVSGGGANWEDDKRLCVMQLANVYYSEALHEGIKTVGTFNEQPAWRNINEVCPVVEEFLVQFNDSIPTTKNSDLQKLKEYIPRLFYTKVDEKTSARAALCKRTLVKIITEADTEKKLSKLNRYISFDPYDNCWDTDLAWEQASKDQRKRSATCFADTSSAVWEWLAAYYGGSDPQEGFKFLEKLLTVRVR